MRVQRTESEKFDEVCAYRTKQQMITSGDYGSEEDVLQIIEEKIRQGYPQVRQHPDNPRNPHLRQYWVSVKTEGTRQHALQHINELTAEGEVGDQAGSCLPSQRLLEAQQPFLMHSTLANWQSFAASRPITTATGKLGCTPAKEPVNHNAIKL